MNIKIKKLLTTSVVSLTILLFLAVPVFAVLSSSTFLPKAQKFIDNKCDKKKVDNQTSLLCYLFYKTEELDKRVNVLEQSSSAIMVDSGWGHFTRIFDGPPETNPTPTIDPTTIAFYASIHNTGTKNDLLIGASSTACRSFGMQDMGASSVPGTGDISGISIPAGTTVELKFMGLRMICNGVNGVQVGDRVPMTLFFDKNNEVPVMIEVRDGPQ
ncbi:copper chaperone PCu(A)C [Patescibacteria group bacterium]|nr:copper chaperone PCu(A)C [Patescibacteria group bacterium]MBU4017358.1 copper chaperone PCu(A)C [Patescibacteria group bacterium]MBU4099122.1 copper chaperone PCu(A)C [Patescibacteria group bacterium]